MNGAVQRTYLRARRSGFNGLISFSNIPMRLLLIGGFLISAMSLTYALAQTIYVLVSETNVSRHPNPDRCAVFLFRGAIIFSGCSW